MGSSPTTFYVIGFSPLVKSFCSLLDDFQSLPPEVAELYMHGERNKIKMSGTATKRQYHEERTFTQEFISAQQSMDNFWLAD